MKYSEIDFIICHACGARVEVERICGEDGSIDLEIRSKCNCPKNQNKKDKSDFDKFQESELSKILTEENKEKLTQYRDIEIMKNMSLERRLELINHTMSSVNADMINSLCLNGSIVPKSYFYKIKSENPSLSVADFIDHIWQIQKNEIDITSNEAKLITFRSRKLIDGVYRSVTSCKTIYDYKFFISRVEDQKEYNGFEIKTGTTDYMNVLTSEIEKAFYVDCIVYRSDRIKPIKYRAFLNEHIKKDDLGFPLKAWRKPSVMLTKIATSMAHKLAFPKQVGNIDINYGTMNLSQEDNQK